MKKYRYLSLLLIMILFITGCESNSENSQKENTNTKKETITYNDVETIYFNPTNNTNCDDYEENNSEYKNIKGCLKWYAYSTNADGTINMILDHDITENVSWNENKSNIDGPSKEFLDTLKNATSEWTGLADRNDKYSVDNGYSKYTIDYTGYKARIISAEEIKAIAKSNVNLYEVGVDYFNIPGWLSDRISSNCKSVGICPNNRNYMSSETTSYWTSSPFVNTTDGKNPVNTGAYMVGFKGKMIYNGTNDLAAIRPVITIKKK